MKMVYGYRACNNPGDLECVINVVAVGTHRYNGSQCEEAIKASTDNHPRARWYVGYGGDYLPACKADLSNISAVCEK